MKCITASLLVFPQKALATPQTSCYEYILWSQSVLWITSQSLQSWWLNHSTPVCKLLLYAGGRCPRICVTDFYYVPLWHKQELLWPPILIGWDIISRLPIIRIAVNPSPSLLQFFPCKCWPLSKIRSTPSLSPSSRLSVHINTSERSW